MKRSLASVALALSTLLLFAAAPLVHAGGVPPVTGASVSQAFSNTPSTFNQGDGADQVSIAVGNTSSTVALTSSLQVDGALPAGITINTPNFVSGDWICVAGAGGSTFTCVRQTSLAPNASDTIVLPLSVSGNAPIGSNGMLTDTISGGGLPSVVSGSDPKPVLGADSYTIVFRSELGPFALQIFPATTA